jgi:anti-sigma factor RsiW
MCNEREKLIGYLYDECESSERAAVQRHLETCAECRAEIASLRSVREDLAGWEVPDHGSVWKPFVAAPAPRWWQHVPQWALAAAAGIVLVSGAAGGAVTHAFMPHAAPALQQAPAGATQVTDTRELAALQQQIAMLRAELAQVNDRVQNVQKTSASAITPDMEAALHKTFDRQLSDLRLQSDKQIYAVDSLYRDLGDYKKSINARVVGMDSKIDNMATVLNTRSGGHQ